MRDKVYICSAFRGDMEDNLRKTKKYCRWAAKECGAIPIAPHLLFPQFLDDSNDSERELGICYGIELLADCSALWYFGDRVTEGMVIEINEAYRLQIPVRYVPDKEIILIENGGFLYE